MKQQYNLGGKANQSSSSNTKQQTLGSQPAEPQYIRQNSQNMNQFKQF